MNIAGINYFGAETPTGEPNVKQVLGKEDFMMLLLKQLSYQDPLNPMDSKEFTVQLTQFTSLEELNNINKSLDNLLTFQLSMQNAAVTNLIGKSVKVGGNSTYLTDTAHISYSLPDDASSVRIVFRDASNQTVRMVDTGSQNAGSKNYIWDGKDDHGKDLPDGTYTFSIEAKDYKGDLMNAATNSTGKVTGIAYDDDMTYLILDGNRKAYLSDIHYIEERRN